jgi:phage gp29-like protein
MLEDLNRLKNKILGKSNQGSKGVVYPTADRYSDYPTNGLTPEKLSRILKQADQGDVSLMMEMFEEMEEKDSHLFSLLQTRKNAVIGLDFEILPYSDDPLDKETADFVSDIFYGIDNIEDLFTDLLDAIGKGFAVGHIKWNREGSKTVVDKVTRIHQKRIAFDLEDRMLIYTEDAPMGRPMYKNEFIVHHYKARSGHPSRAGVLRNVSWAYLFKNYALKDWVVFAESYGMPMRIGTFSPSATDADIKTLEQAVLNLGSAYGVTISENTKIELKEAIKGGNASVYETLLRFCNSEMSKAILGQTLTTEMGSSGSLAASQTHNSVRQDILEADCKALAQTLMHFLIRPIVLHNFIDYPKRISRLPYIKFHSSPPEDLKQEAETYKILIADVGLPVSKEHLYEKFGIPKPDPKQELIRPSDLGTPASFKELALTNKAVDNSGVVKQYQQAIDHLVDLSVPGSLQLFEKTFENLGQLLDQAKSPEALMQLLSHTETLDKIVKPEDLAKFQEVLHKAMFLSDLVGRMRDDE